MRFSRQTSTMRVLLVVLLVTTTTSARTMAATPFVINTWAFTNATQTAWDVIWEEKRSALDAVEAGCSRCEENQCDGTVGYGGSPNEAGETTLDAMIMDGPTHDVGAVGSLRRVKSAISVARKVLEHTQHTLLVGDEATQFAVQMGFREESLSTDSSKEVWLKWKENNCQPNYWKNVEPDPRSSCGPYRPLSVTGRNRLPLAEVASLIDESNHDTIGMIALDTQGRLAAGTSTNGATHKIPGRVGDSPIPGSGAYVDQDVGAAVGTGDGDVMMRLLPSYQAVEYMRTGMSPQEAAENVISRIKKKYPQNQAAVVVANINGEFGASCCGFGVFPYSVCSPSSREVTVIKVDCL